MLLPLDVAVCRLVLTVVSTYELRFHTTSSSYQRSVAFPPFQLCALIEVSINRPSPVHLI